MALRLIVSSPAISRELWICSPKGAWRFFSIGDESITELVADGELLTAGTAGTAVVPRGVQGQLIQMPSPGEISIERMGSVSEKSPVQDIKRM
jgi:hypothetical protein